MPSEHYGGACEQFLGSPQEGCWAEAVRGSIAAMGDRVGQGGFSRASRPDDRDQTGIQFEHGRDRPRSILDLDAGDDLRWCRPDRRLFPDKSPAGGIDARLSERIEGWDSLDPGIAISVWDADGARLMRIAAVDARFQVPIPLAYLFCRQAAPSEPKVSLRSTAREDDMSEFFHLLTKRRVGAI